MGLRTYYTCLYYVVWSLPFCQTFDCVFGASLSNSHTSKSNDMNKYHSCHIHKYAQNWITRILYNRLISLGANFTKFMLDHFYGSVVGFVMGFIVALLNIVYCRWLHKVDC